MSETELSRAGKRFSTKRQASRDRRELLDAYVGISRPSRFSNRPSFNPATALGEQDPALNRGLGGFIEQDPAAFAKGVAVAPFTAAPDLVGLAQQGVNAGSDILSEQLGTPNFQMGVMSGDPIREAVGLSPDNPQGLAGEVASPIGTIAKGLGVSLKAVTAGAKLAAGTGFDPSLAMTLFHGTPFKFNKFDSAAIGTGEGAQAFGHGLYFAERQGVARSYLPSGDDVFVQFKGKPVDTPWTQDILDRWPDEFKGLNEQTADDLNVVLANIGNSNAQDLDSVVMGFNGREKRVYEQLVKPHIEVPTNPTGHLYEVDIPDEITNKMLDWDAPLSEQPESVRQKLIDVIESRRSPGLDYNKWAEANGRGIGLDASTSDLSAYRSATGKSPTAQPFLDTDPTGEKLYRSFGLGAEDTSKFLNEAGIPGIRFFDGGSRMVGDQAEFFISKYGSLDEAKRIVSSHLDDAVNKLGEGSETVRNLRKTLTQIDAGGPTRNIVVFNPDDITQVKRDGEIVHRALRAGEE